MKSQMRLRSTVCLARFAAVAATPSAQDDALSKIRAVSGALGQASARRDGDAYSRATTNDFIRIGGRIRTKQEWLRESVTRGEQGPADVNSDEHFVVRGSIALDVARHASPRPDANGQPQPPQRMTRGFVRQGEDWLVAATFGAFIRPTLPPDEPLADADLRTRVAPSADEPLSLLRQVVAAEANNDTATLARLTADDFFGANAMGGVLGKADYLRQFASAGARREAQFEPRALTLNLYDGGAVAACQNAAG